MKVAELLAHLEATGITVVARGEHLHCSAPRGLLTPTLKAALREHKPALLGLLSEKVRPQPVENDINFAPLSSSQHRLWLCEQLRPGTASFNLPLAIRLIGKVNAAALAQSLTEIVRRHEILRTVYGIRNGEPYQHVTAACAVPLRCVDLSKLEVEQAASFMGQVIRQEVLRPFDLERDLIMRSTLLRLDDRQHVLLLTRHHIASDGWSLGILLRELALLYESYCTGGPSPLQELPYQYTYYATQEHIRSDAALNAQTEYWQRQLSDATQAFEPFANAGLEVALGDGAMLYGFIPLPLAEKVRNFCRTSGVTLFTLHLTAFVTVLYHLTRHTNIVVGTDYNQRNQTETEGMIGLFLNRVALRVNLAGNPLFSELLSRVKAVTISASANAGVAFERLVALLNPERRSTDNSLFQVFFGLHAAPRHAPYRELKLHGIEENQLLECHNQISQFKLSLYVTDSPSGFFTEARYDSRIFSEERIRRLLAQFELVLAEGTMQPNLMLEMINARLTEADQQKTEQQSAEFRAFRSQHWKSRRARRQ
jgi:NRPS condensation-like uncharacterized protein